MELTTAGLKKDTPAELLELLTKDLKSEMPDFANLPSELQTNLLQETVVLELQIQDMIANAMNGIGLGYANDFIFNELGEAFGIKRKTKTHANVNVKFTGKTGVIIPEGVQVSNADSSMIFTTTTQDIIKENGEVVILCESEDDITDTIGANTINVLISDIIGLESCNNESAGNNGIAEESISEYRERVQNTIQSPRYGNISYARDLLLKITGVDKRLLYMTMNNDNKIECVVGGGGDYEVAQALFNSFLYPNVFASNPSDSDAARTIDLQVIFQGVNYQIIYTRPKISKIDININLKLQYGSFSMTSEELTILLKDKFREYIDNQIIGSDLSLYNLTKILFDIFESEEYNENIINDVVFEVSIDGTKTDFDKNNRIETAYDVAYIFNNLELILLFGDNR